MSQFTCIHCGQSGADGPAPNPQALLNSLGSVVTAAGSVANAQQALSSAANGGSGDMLQSAGSAAQALAVSTLSSCSPLNIPCYNQLCNTTAHLSAQSSHCGS